VAVRDPARPAAALRHVYLRDGALSTSGSSQRFVDVDGRRYTHIIDPRTGTPAEGGCQVTVTAPTATDSDAFTKPAFLLPRDEVAKLFSGRDGVHVLRIDGTCAPGGEVWTTAWSNDVFRNP
jgi:thiamine biosynthesis lipoprotein